MKYFKIPFLISVVILFCHCSKKNDSENEMIFTGTESLPGEKAIITGKIHNQDVYPKEKLLEITLFDFEGAQTVYSSPISEDGMFYFEIYPFCTREIAFNPVEERIIISPGDSLYIEKDFKEIDKTKFSGTNAELNQHTSNFRGKYLGRYVHSYELSFTEFKGLCDSLLSDNQNLLKDFRRKNKVSDTFIKWAEKQILFDYYDALFKFPFQHFLITKEQLAGKEKVMYYDFVREFEDKVDNSLLMADYFKVVEGYTGFIINPDYSDIYNKDAKPIDAETALKKFKSASKNSFLNQFLVSNYLNTVFLKANKTEWIDSNKVAINQLISDPFLRQTLNNRYNWIKSYKENPRVYSDVVLGNNSIEIRGKGFEITDSTNVMKHIIDSNPGQVLFVDFWAPWCGPCVDLLSYSKALNQHFEDKPVTFVYICIGSTHEKWKEVIEKYQLSGVHHLCSSEEQSDVMKRFKTNAIPYYILFDKNGTMVDFGLHLTPNKPETKQAIEKLLQ